MIVAPLLCVDVSDGGPSALVVAFAGELDLMGVPKVREVLAGAVTSAETVIIDLSELSFIDARGAGALAETALDASRLGRTVHLRSPSPWVRRVLGLMQYDGLLAP